MTAKSDLMSDEMDKVMEGTSGLTTKEKRKVEIEDHETSVINRDPKTGSYMKAVQLSSSSAFSHSVSTGDNGEVGEDTKNYDLRDLGRLGEIKLSTKVTTMDDLGASFLNSDDEEDDEDIYPFTDMNKLSTELRTERFVESTVGENINTHMMGDDIPSSSESSKDLVKRIFSESHGSSIEKSKFKVSMGAQEDDDNVSGYSSKYSSQGQCVIGSERKSNVEGSQSLFERRLQSMGNEPGVTDTMHPSLSHYDSYESSSRRPYSNSSDYSSLESDLETSRRRL